MAATKLGMAGCCSNPATGSGATGTLPNCFCPNPPATLVMTSADPSCNWDMFQNCIIQYQPVPPVYAPLGLGEMAYISNQSFPDPAAGNVLFQYYLSCQYNVFILTRIFPTSPYGSPFRDAVLYTWYVGAYGNACNPFSLDNGLAYPGSDTTCSVAIDAA